MSSNSRVSPIFTGLPLVIVLLTGTICSVAARTTYERGVEFYNSRQYRDALLCFDKALQEEQQSASVLYYQALCWQRLGEIETARKLYLRITGNYPNTPAAANARLALQHWPATRHNQSNHRENSRAPSPDNLATIPFCQTEDGMFIDITIDGKPVQALWDTGAARTFFSRSKLTAAGIDAKGTATTGTILGVGGETAVSSMPCLIQAGGQRARLHISIHDDSKSNGQYQFAVLGQDFFGDYVYEVDPKNKVIRLLKKAGVRPFQLPLSMGKAPVSSEPFTWHNNVMLIKAQINGRDVEMLFDTGAAVISFSDKQLSAAGLNRPIESSPGTTHGVGGRKDAFRFSLDTVQFGSVLKTSVSAHISIHGLQSRPLLGQSFMRGLHYIVDPDNRLIHVIHD